MVNIESVIQQLQPTLVELEVVRAAYRKKARTFTISLIIGIVFILGVGLIIDLMILMAATAIGVAVIAAITYQFTIRKTGHEYTTRFKSAVIPQIAKLIDPSLQYDHKRGIDQETFMTTELFTTRPDRYRTEDLIWGKYGETFFQVAEIHAEDRRTRTDSDGNTETYYVTIFKGLLLIADFHKHFHGRTFLFPDNAEKMFGKIGRGFQKMAGRSGTKLVQMDSPEFESAFAIYSNDPVECRYILSTSMMERILDMRRRFQQTDIRVGFKESCVMIAVPHSHPYLEPHTSLPATDAGQVNRMLGELKAFLDIIEELNLNTRIWSKE